MDEIWISILLAAFAFMHIFYMIAVVNENVLKQIPFPRDAVDILRRALTLSLCLAYAAPLIIYVVGLFVATGMQGGPVYVLDFGPTGHLSKLISLILFAVVYITWIVVDVIALKQAQRDTHYAVQHAIRNHRKWIAIEGFSLAIVGFGILNTLGVFQIAADCSVYQTRDACLLPLSRWTVIGTPISIIDWKDGFVLVCSLLFGWELARHNSMPPTDLYVAHYLRYLNAIRVGGVELTLEPSCLEELRAAVRDSPVLDFACGDGRRFTSFAKDVLGLSSEERGMLTIHGLDRNGRWKSHFLLGEGNRSFDVRIAQGALYKVVHLSHVLYEKEAALAVIDAINNHAGKGAFVLVRGASPRTVFYLLSVGLSASLLAYHPHHHWPELYLSMVFDACNLRLTGCDDGALVRGIDLGRRRQILINEEKHRRRGQLGSGPRYHLLGVITGVLCRGALGA